VNYNNVNIIHLTTLFFTADVTLLLGGAPGLFVGLVDAVLCILAIIVLPSP
jgi:hypothetical protein